MKLSQKETQRPVEEKNISSLMYRSLILGKNAKSAYWIKDNAFSK